MTLVSRVCGVRLPDVEGSTADALRREVGLEKVCAEVVDQWWSSSEISIAADLLSDGIQASLHDAPTTEPDGRRLSRQWS